MYSETGSRAFVVKSLDEVVARDPARVLSQAGRAGFEPAKPCGQLPCTPNRQSSEFFQYLFFLLYFDRRSDDQRVFAALPLSYGAA